MDTGLEPERRARYLAERGRDSRFMFRWFELADFDGPLISNLIELLARRGVALNMTFLVNVLVYNADDVYHAASFVLSQNLVHGDALTMRTTDGQPIIFAEWGYLGKGKFQRRDFRLDVLTGSSKFSAEDSLFAHLGKHEIFTPIKIYPTMTVRDLARADGGTPQEAA